VSTTPPARAALDVRALVEPVDRAAVRAVHRDARGDARATRAHPRPSVASRALGVVLRTALLAVLLAVAAAVVGAVLALIAVGLGATGVGVPAAVVLVTAGTVVIGLLVARGARRASAREREVTYRLGRFAAANGFAFEPRVDEPEQPSAAFDLGILRVARNVVRTPGPRAVEVGTYSYSAGYRDAEPFAWTYATTTLDRPLPHLVVETLPGRGAPGARAPRGVDRTWELPLDGPSGDRHRAYGPVRSARETARTVFAPGLVETLVAGRFPLAAEVTGDRLFLFSERPLDLLDPAVWERLLGTADEIAARLTDTAGPRRPAWSPDER